MSGAATIQGRDPMAGLEYAIMARTIAVVVLVYVLWVTVSQFPRYSSPVFVLVGTALLLASALVLARSADPLRAPYTRSRFVTVTGLALLAQVFETLGGAGAQWSSYIHWGPVVIGLLLAAHAGFRPARELFVVGLVSSLLLGATAVVFALVMPDGTPVAATALLFAIPPFIIAMGAAAFSASILASLDRWRSVDVRSPEVEADAAEGLARAVQQSHVTVLNREVVPLLTGVLERGVLTADDIVEAQRVADAMRASLVVGSHRSWLDAELERRGRVDDPDQLARWMTPEQRSAIRALMDHFEPHPAFDEGVSLLRLREVDGVCTVTMQMHIDLPDHAVRVESAPYLAALRAVFDDVVAEHDGPTRTLRFRYAR